MKKQFIALLLLSVVFTSCQTSGLKLVKNLEKYLQNHCEGTYDINPLNGDTTSFHYKCGKLWDAGVLSDKCSQADICINLAQGEIWSDVVCDSIVDPYYFLKSAKPSQSKVAARAGKK